MSIAERIRTKLQQHLSPSLLDVVDDSARHEGHAGALPGGETHFRVKVVTDAFEGLSRIDRHRTIHALLGEEFAERLHALKIQALSSSEHEQA